MSPQIFILNFSSFSMLEENNISMPFIWVVVSLFAVHASSHIILFPLLPAFAAITTSNVYNYFLNKAFHERNFFLDFVKFVTKSHLFNGVYCAT